MASNNSPRALSNSWKVKNENDEEQDDLRWYGSRKSKRNVDEEAVGTRNGTELTSYLAVSILFGSIGNEEGSEYLLYKVEGRSIPSISFAIP